MQYRASGGTGCGAVASLLSTLSSLRTVPPSGSVLLSVNQITATTKGDRMLYGMPNKVRLGGRHFARG